MRQLAGRLLLQQPPSLSLAGTSSSTGSFLHALHERSWHLATQLIARCTTTRTAGSNAARRRRTNSSRSILVLRMVTPLAAAPAT